MTREQEAADGVAAAAAAAAGNGASDAVPLRLRYTSSSSTSDMEAGLQGSAPEPISRYESRPPKDAGARSLSPPLETISHVVSTTKHTIHRCVIKANQTPGAADQRQG